MTTERQKVANAANATKSTGPRTTEGRAKAAGNARKHGLNTTPPWNEVSSYLTLILGSAGMDPLSLDTQSRAALALAEAEARLARCLMEERRQLVRMTELAAQKPFVPTVKAAEPTIKQKFDANTLPDWQRARQTDWSNSQMPIFHEPPAPDESEVLRRSIKTLTRYRREADAQKRKALRHWLEVQAAED